MVKYNPKNERIKRQYFIYLRNANGKSDATIEAMRKSLLQYETHTGFKEFGALHPKNIIAFKCKLLEQKNKRTGATVSMASIHTTLQHLKAFFRWLAHQNGFKSKIHVPDIEYFSLTDKQVSVAKSQIHKDSPTIEQIRHVIAHMQPHDDITRRNQALIAFTLLSGMRDSAIISLKLKHVNLQTGLITQDPREVKTKASKTIHTYFFPVGDDIRTIVVDWVNYLRTQKLFGLNDPLFPKTALGLCSVGGFEAQGLSREHWQSAAPMRGIFRKAFEAAGLPYYHPHLFRHTLAAFGQSICQTPEQFKAWSQNIGHSDVLTTFTSYGTLSVPHQGSVMKSLCG